MTRECVSVFFHDAMPATNSGVEMSSFARASLIGGAAALAIAVGSALGPVAKAQETTGQPQQSTGEQPQPSTGDQPQQDGTASGMAGAPAASQQGADIAGAEEAAEVPVEGQIVQQEEGTLAASRLIGVTAISPAGEPIGTVTDLLLTEDNQVDGIVVGMGGFLGIGQKEVALKMSEVSLAGNGEADERILVLNSTLEAFEQAPQFVSLDDQQAAALQEQLRREAENAATPAPGNAPAASTAPPPATQ